MSQLLKSLFIKRSKVNYNKLSLNLRFITNVCNNCENKQNLENISENMDLTNENEDISSHVRYSREWIGPQVEHFSQLYRNDSHLRLKVELICAEFEYLRHSSNRCKQLLTIEDMKRLIQLSAIPRQKLFNIMFIKDIQNISKKLRKKILLENNCISENEIQMKPNKRIGIYDENGEIKYGFSHNSMFSRIQFPKNDVIIAQKHRNAMLFGQNLVIDWNCDLESLISERSVKRMSNQVVYIYGNNRHKYSNPYYLHFANLNPNTISYKHLNKILPNLNDKGFNVNITQKSYLDLFSNQNIIYITTHAEEELTAYDCNAVYVMSPLLESVRRREDFINAKISKENVKYMRLPFDKHLKLKKGQYICINHWVDCMHDLKNGLNWKEAFERHIPRGKLLSVKDQQYITAQQLLKHNKYDLHLSALNQI